MFWHSTLQYIIKRKIICSASVFGGEPFWFPICKATKRCHDVHWKKTSVLKNGIFKFLAICSHYSHTIHWTIYSIFDFGFHLLNHWLNLYTFTWSICWNNGTRNNPHFPEHRTISYSWNEMKTAQSQVHWRGVVEGLCSSCGNGPK